MAEHGPTKQRRRTSGSDPMANKFSSIDLVIHLFKNLDNCLVVHTSRIGIGYKNPPLGKHRDETLFGQPKVVPVTGLIGVKVSSFRS